MKRIVALLLVIISILTLASSALAYSFSDTHYSMYVVESYNPNGYCYLYDRPSSSKGRNLGRYNNGSRVRVVFNDGSFSYVVTSDNKEGYIRTTSLSPVAESVAREYVRVYSTNPSGYCYMYDRPSSVNGVNMGRYNNGAYLQLIDWYADTNYAKVMSPETRKYGYVRKNQLVFEDEYKPVQAYAVVDSSNPKGYCYMYDRPGSTYGNNMGRYNNGESMLVIDWYADDNYALVESVSNHKIGYVRKNCMRKY